MAQKSSNPIWNFFCSVRLTLILLIILAIASIFGTLLPQKEAAIRFTRELSPELVKLFNYLQLFDIYNSVWFILIIGCLALNLTVCSINRFPATLKLFKLIPKPDRSKPFEGLPPQRTLHAEGDPQEAADNVMKFLKGLYKNILIKTTDKGSFLYAEKGRFTLFGVYIIHLSILFILTGAIVRSIFGFNAYVNILEGELVDTVILRNSTGHNHKDLGFSVYCENFSIDFYDNGMPKEYRSDLNFIVDGNTVQKGILLVNHPITFKGVTFYQASYGSTSGDRARLRISNPEVNIHDSTLELELGKPVSLPGNGGYFILSDIREDFMRMGPAVLISIMPEEGEETSFWLFQNHDIIKKQFPEIFEDFPKLNPSAYRPYTFYLEDIETKYYTGLQVNRDPGVPFVYIGFFMIIFGLLITFFTSHRRVWVRITGKPGKMRISVAGKANKNPVGMEKELDRLVSKLNNHLNPEREI